MTVKLENLIDKLDESAENLSKGHYDENVFELEFNLWGLVHLLAKESPAELKESFKFSDEVVSALGLASRTSIGKLANPHLLSFALKSKESSVREAIDELKIENYHYVYLSNSVDYDEFSYAYWQILNRLSIKDLDYAAVVFGVSTSLADEIRSLTDIKLRLLAAKHPPVFQLRFCQSVILERLNDTGSEAISFFKGIQLALKI